MAIIKVKPQPKTRRRPSIMSLQQLADKLFPITPIEARLEDGEYHVYVEGQWCAKEISLNDVETRLLELIENQGDDWFYPSTRVVPDWAGWNRISMVELAQFLNPKEDD